ncbi:MAG: NADH-quinone oxidoreductase subunit C [Thermodesulfobacteriota bacterium]
MNQETIRERVEQKFGVEVVENAALFRDQMTLTVSKDKVHEVLAFLKNDPDLSFDFLSFVGGVDRLPDAPRFEVVYQLYSMTHNHRFRVSARVPEEEDGLGSIRSAVDLWPTADWHERETAEMYGIVFEHHPDPRKLLLPEHWTVYPLRKDFPLEGTEEHTPDLKPSQHEEREGTH